MIYRITLAFLCLFLPFLNAAEKIKNSIIPTMEKFEFLENLPVKKYSNNQYLEILHILSQKEDRIRVVSYQIFSQKKDSQEWKNNAMRIVKLMKNMQPDIFSLQSIDRAQLHDLQFFFKNDYQCYGDLENQYRNGNAIFVRKNRFDVQDQEIYLLPGKKTLTALQLLDRQTQKSFTVLNTRLTYDQPDQREQEVVSINQCIAPILTQMPVILSGAFHTFPHRLDLTPLPFYDGDYLQRIFSAGSLKDARKKALLGQLGTLTTLSKGAEGLGIYPDHIFVSEDVQVLFYAIEGGTVGKHYPSDHMPIVVDLIIK